MKIINNRQMNTGQIRSKYAKQNKIEPTHKTVTTENIQMKSRFDRTGVQIDWRWTGRAENGGRRTVSKGEWRAGRQRHCVVTARNRHLQYSDAAQGRSSSWTCSGSDKGYQHQGFEAFFFLRPM